MENKSRSIALEIGFLILVLVAATAFYRAHTRQPYSAPIRTVAALMAAAQSANLDAFRDASSPAYYQEFVRHFGEEKYRRTVSIFDAVTQSGNQLWSQYRYRADEQARMAVRRLQEKTATSGKEAFLRLGVEERMKLIENRADYDRFLQEAGKKALSEEERKMMSALEAFSRREETADALAQAWQLISEEDRKALGNAGALSSGQTLEKLAFIDRTIIPMLAVEIRKEIEGIQRSELADPDAFRFKYGQLLAKAFFQDRQIRIGSIHEPCAFPKQDQQGSYLRGEIAICTASTITRVGTLPTKFTLKKIGFDWLMVATEPELYNIPW
jgi:hypothetical protein